MAGKDLPMDVSFVQGLGYASFPTPTNDSCSLKGTDQDEVMGAPYSKPAPLQAVSLATKEADADPSGLGARQKSNLHKDGWLDYLEPHVGNTNS